jgi:hypothetical protein
MGVADEAGGPWIRWANDPAGVLGEILSTSVSYDDVFSLWQNHASGLSAREPERGAATRDGPG